MMITTMSFHSSIQNNRIFLLDVPGAAFSLEQHLLLCLIGLTNETNKTCRTPAGEAKTDSEEGNYLVSN